MKMSVDMFEGVRLPADQRRRTRRVRMIVELTSNLIRSDQTVSAREARCLVNCARKAILELVPGYDMQYALLIAPIFDSILRKRWPNDHLSGTNYELVN